MAGYILESKSADVLKYAGVTDKSLYARIFGDVRINGEFSGAPILIFHNYGSF